MTETELRDVYALREEASESIQDIIRRLIVEARERQAARGKKR
jgi:hypothetical protein